MAKTIVKHWWGSFNDSNKATFKEFNTKKEAEKYINQERKINGKDLPGAANYYEMYCKK
jgi:hypothetical protein